MRWHGWRTLLVFVTGTDLAGDPVWTEFTEAEWRRDLAQQRHNVEVFDSTSAQTNITHTHTPTHVPYCTGGANRLRQTLYFRMMLRHWIVRKKNSGISTWLWSTVCNRIVCTVIRLNILSNTYPSCWRSFFWHYGSRDYNSTTVLARAKVTRDLHWTPTCTRHAFKNVSYRWCGEVYWLCLRVILGPLSDELVEVMWTEDGPVAGEVVEVVHDDCHEQVDYLHQHHITSHGEYCNYITAHQQPSTEATLQVN